MTHERIEQIENDYNVTILYVTEYGSKLYGTDTPESDTDYRGIFLPSYDSRILGTDPDYIKLDTNTSNEANSSKDIDIHLDSIHKWFNLLAKGETGAIDVLFSMWSSSSTYFVPTFTDWVKGNYLSLITSNPKAFCGYAIGQAKRNNVKGQRYNELCEFISNTKQAFNFKELVPRDQKLGHTEMDLSGYKYINWKEAEPPRGQSGTWTYLEVLGKLYPPTWKLDFVLEKLEEMKEQYGDRAKKAVDNVDWKALSHALRVVQEVKELLSTRFIKFPLQDRRYILEIKQGKHELEDIVQELSNYIEEIDELVKITDLPNKVDQNKIDKFILELYRDQNENN